MADPKLRLVALTVLGGALHGRRHNPDEVVTEILVGSDPDCHLVVDLPGVSPIHARVWADLDQSLVYETRAPRGLYVNTDRVDGQAPVGEGDVLWLGPPQEADSVCVQLHFEPWVERLPPAGPAAWEAPAEPAEAAPASPDATPPDAAPFGTVPGEVTFEKEPPAQAATSDGAMPEGDPFFVGGEVETTPAPPGVPPLPDAAPPIAAPPSAGPPLPRPEDLVAQTIAEDDWAIAEPTPPVAVPPPTSPPADTFFLADGSLPADGPAEPFPAEPVVPASLPALELPSLDAPSAGLPSVTPGGPRPAPPALARVPEPSPPAPPSTARVPAGAPKRTPVVASAPAPGEPARAEARPTPAPRPERPPAARRPASPAAARPPARRPPSAARSAGRPPRGTPGWRRPVVLGVAALAVLGAVGFVAVRLLGGDVRLDAVEPARVRVGQRATLTGAGFASDTAGNTVLFDGREAKVLQASPTRLEVEVPEAVTESGAEKRVAVVVRRGGRTSSALDVAVFQGPRLHGLSPEVAMPGEEVTIAGAGWGPGSTVRFGAAIATLNEVQPTRIRAVVPEGAGAPGTPAPVVVTVGGVDSNPGPFIVGRLPVVTGVTPTKAASGDVVEVSGRGFQDDPLRNDVRIGGVPALALESSGDAMKVVVPRLASGELSRPLEVRVPGSDAVGQAMLEVEPPADPVPFRFVAEPFTDVAGRSHAVLSTGLGPAFVLAAAGGKSGAARALEAAGRLNAAAETLRTTVGLNLEATGFDSTPVLTLAGRPDALLEVTPEDAAAYGEDWTGLRGRGGPVTPARLARWWEAVGRDLVLLTVRGERPRHAAELAPEGRVLGQVFDAAQRSGRAGVPKQVVDEARPPLRDGLRMLALRVPASVTAPRAAAPLAPAAAATPAPARLQLEGTWAGSQLEQGQRQYLTVVFRREGGSIAYEGGITLTVPFLTFAQPRRDQARFSVQMRGGIRHYVGNWDGEKLAGSISTDAQAQNVVATFELRKR